MRLLPSLLLAVVLPAGAQVYKSIGPDGRPIFTDRPLPDAQSLVLPRPRHSVPAESGPAQQPGESGFLGSYDAFEIVAPADGDTIRDADGNVMVSLLLDPPLLAGHRLSVEVDGVAASGDLAGRTQMRLQGVHMGSHLLLARVFDDAGNVVAATSSVHFHLREPLPAGSLP